MCQLSIIQAFSALDKYCNKWLKNFDKRPHRRFVILRDGERWTRLTLAPSTCNIWFLGPMHVIQPPNGISIGSADFAGLND